MGILNLSENSFYDGGMYLSDQAILNRASQILEEGAQIIDLGAASSQPGSNDIPENIESERITHAVKLIRLHFPDAILSIDTWRASIAEKAVNAGANIINDISGGSFDPLMPSTIGKLQVPYILTHSTAKPKIMQQTLLNGNPLPQMLQFFGNQINTFKKAGCKDLILDPGFGFGKSIEQNFFLLANLQTFQIFELPILIGISRKSMIYRTLDCQPKDALAGTIALNTIAIQKGAAILRVHDVKDAVDIISLYQKMAQATACDTTASHQ